jgi:hypothetical protein
VNSRKFFDQPRNRPNGTPRPVEMMKAYSTRRMLDQMWM